MQNTKVSPQYTLLVGSYILPLTYAILSTMVNLRVEQIYLL